MVELVVFLLIDAAGKFFSGLLLGLGFWYAKKFVDKF